MKKSKSPQAPPYPVRLDAITYLKIRAIAELESRSMNKQIELSIKRMISDYEKQNGEICVDANDLDE